MNQNNSTDTAYMSRALAARDNTVRLYRRPLPGVSERYEVARQNEVIGIVARTETGWCWMTVSAPTGSVGLGTRNEAILGLARHLRLVA